MKKINVSNLGSSGEIMNAEITPGESIRIFGVKGNRANGPVEFDLTFKVGDVAEYDSYNLIYTGRITKIGPKTVTIQHYETGPRSSRLRLSEFSWRNWDFNSEVIASRNSDTMMRI